MNAEEYSLAFAWDLAVADLNSPRQNQDEAGILGASSFGCREQMRRVLVKAPKTDTPKQMPALLGSYCDAGFKHARKLANPKLLLAEELPCVLPNGHEILVHPDEIDQDEPSVTDYKAPKSLAAIKRGFADERYRRQRHIQYLAAHQNGLVPPSGITRNVFVARSGDEETPWVEQEEYNTEVILEATEFLDDVLYAVAHDEEAAKDTPRYVCRDYCPWFTACRGNEIELPEITDPALIRLVAAYHEAKATEKEAASVAADLRDAGIDGLTGMTPTHSIVTTHVSPVNKAPYTRIETRAL